jgi:RHS repeat-associated protein
MITRTVNEHTFNFGYDAENRLVSVSGAATASFVYDGDGNRVQSTINGTTTTFIGNYYSVTDSIVTKNYYAGTQLIATRKGDALSYLLSDHLGSISLTVDSNRNVTASQRFTPWGEVRAPTGTMPTSYAFTGQYSDSYINLLWYGSREYDPAIGRFISPDTIVPTSTQGVQAWDRYAYANNNPLYYTDPSGNTPCADDYYWDGTCHSETEYVDKTITTYYKWTLSGKWSLGEKWNILTAASNIESYVDKLTYGNGLAWMRKYLGGTTFVHGTLAGHPYTTGDTVHMYQNMSAEWITHELGHVWDNNSQVPRNTCAATICGGGDADLLQVGIDGNPAWPRAWNGLFGNVSSGVPNGYDWALTVDKGYGNNGTAEYFAQAFRYMIYDPSKIPDPYHWNQEVDILDSLIIGEAQGLP